MFFFFIGGVQPKTITLDETPRLCPNCGLAQARLKRIDHYLSIFFIPIVRLKKGEPIVICERCGFSSPENETFQGWRRQQTPKMSLVCQSCGATLEPSFRYCPQCGTKI
ncbi:MAG: zinc ribbon domain-containing protein [Syntrophobacterales bacterium]|nr:zinc ribbon domain-containing protein [Syntrophobacterales bacterium]